MPELTADVSPFRYYWTVRECHPKQMTAGSPKREDGSTPPPNLGCRPVPKHSGHSRHWPPARSSTAESAVCSHLARRAGSAGGLLRAAVLGGTGGDCRADGARPLPRLSGQGTARVF